MLASPSVGRAGRWRRCAALSLVVALAAGCQVDTRVAVEVAPDGSGLVAVTVALDEAAAARVPELDEQLEVGDLEATGWAVERPRREGDGGVTVSASKPFASPEAAALVLAELTGPDGPFRDLVVERRPDLLRDRWRLTGAVDLSGGLAGFSDDALRQRLDGTDVGVAVVELEAAAGRPLAEAATFEVVVTLPGDMAVDGRGVAGAATWRPVLGERLDLVATGTTVRTTTAGWLGGAAVAALALVVLLARRLLRRARAGAPGSEVVSRR